MVMKIVNSRHWKSIYSAMKSGEYSPGHIYRYNGYKIIIRRDGILTKVERTIQYYDMNYDKKATLWSRDAKNRYHRLKRLGLCTICGKRKSHNGTATCKICKERRIQNDNIKRRENQTANEKVHRNSIKEKSYQLY